MRAECKLWILKHYLLLSKRFLLTFHTLQKTHQKELDTFVGVDIPSISAVYMEAHNVSHARTRLQGDVIVNHVLDHAVECESYYTCRQGTN